MEDTHNSVHAAQSGGFDATSELKEQQNDVIDRRDFLSCMACAYFEASCCYTRGCGKGAGFEPGCRRDAEVGDRQD